MKRCMPYALAKVLRAGTFTAGIAADWYSQFSGCAQVMALPMFAGEINLGASSGGVCALYCFHSTNGFDATLDVEASAGAPTQIYINPCNGVAVPSYELAAAATQLISAGPGYTTLAFVRSIGPLIVVPQTTLFDPTGKTGKWVSPYFPGVDPFTGGAGVGGPSSSSSSTTA